MRKILRRAAICLGVILCVFTSKEMLSRIDSGADESMITTPDGIEVRDGNPMGMPNDLLSLIGLFALGSGLIDEIYDFAKRKKS